ncbi:hypothetical protein SDJN02_07686, partial [Cucurbita argyrosperma subsp. argyrosperma]
MVRLLRSSSRKLRPFKLEHREKLASTEKNASFVAALEHVRKPRKSCLTVMFIDADHIRVSTVSPSTFKRGGITGQSIFIRLLKGKDAAADNIFLQDGIETPHL